MLLLDLHLTSLLVLKGWHRGEERAFCQERLGEQRVGTDMWERTLQDLIRGLRANKKDEAKFIAQAVDEIRKEVRSKDMELKAAAILKLTYVSAFMFH